ncbi:unnamed protein product, partial [Chrysoparadoxa australica]
MGVGGGDSQAVRARWLVALSLCLLAAVGVLLGDVFVSAWVPRRTARAGLFTSHRSLAAFLQTAPASVSPTRSAENASERVQSPHALEDRLAAKSKRQSRSRWGWALGVANHDPRTREMFQRRRFQHVRMPAPADTQPASARSKGTRRQEAGKVRRLEGIEMAPVPPPRPETLPQLSPMEMRDLRNGERVQRQHRQDGKGSGMVVLDVRAEPETVMGMLLNYYAYTEMIDTVRETKVFWSKDKTTKAEFHVSKFRLAIRVLLSHMHEQNVVKFSLDSNEGGRAEQRGKGYTRVWMKAEVETSPLVPPFIVDYAARRALPRASSWLRPMCE